MIKKILSLFTLIAFLVLSLCSFTFGETPDSAISNTPLDSISFPVQFGNDANIRYFTISDPRIFPVNLTDYQYWEADGATWNNAYYFPDDQALSLQVLGRIRASSENIVAYTKLDLISRSYQPSVDDSTIFFRYDELPLIYTSVPSIDSTYSRPQRFFFNLYTNQTLISRERFLEYGYIKVTGEFYVKNNTTGEFTLHQIDQYIDIGSIDPPFSGGRYTIEFYSTQLVRMLDIPATAGSYVRNLTLAIGSEVDYINSIEFMDIVTPRSVIDNAFVDALTSIPTFPEDPWRWLADSADTVLSIELMPGLSLFSIVTGFVGISLLFFIIKRFAGG